MAGCAREIEAVARRAQQGPHAARNSTRRSPQCATRDLGARRGRGAGARAAARGPGVGLARRLDSFAEFSERVAKEYADDPVAADVATTRSVRRSRAEQVRAASEQAARASRSLRSGLRAAVAEIERWSRRCRRARVRGGARVGRGRGGEARDRGKRSRDRLRRCWPPAPRRSARRRRRVQGPLEVAAYGWLELLDAGRFDDAWRDGDALLRNGVTQVQWNEAMRKVRDGFGPIASRRVANKDYHRQIEGGPDGNYFTLRVATTFSDGRERWSRW